MAQSSYVHDHLLKEVVVKVGDEDRNEIASQQDDPAVDFSLKGLSSRRRNKELSKSKKDEEFEEVKEEAIRERSSKDSFKQKSRMVRAKSRLEDPSWGYERLGKASNNRKADDWFLDEDFLGEFHLRKSSLLAVVQLIGLVLILAMLACTLSIAELKKQTLWDLPLWKWEMLISVIICGHLVSGWGVQVIVFIIERSFLWKIRVLYFVYGMKKDVQNCLWLGLVLTAWHFVVAENNVREIRSRVLSRVTKIFVCLWVGTVIWLVKTLIVKVLASNFHMSAFFEQIKESLFKQYVIKQLSGSPIIEEQHEERVMGELKKDPELSGESSKGQYERHTFNSLHKLIKKNVSALKMKRLINLVQNGFLSTLSTLDEDLPDSTDEDEPSLHIRDECQAKTKAKRIFRNVAREGSQYIYVYDLKRFMDEDKALMTMELFKGATDSRGISKESFTDWMIIAYRERRDLSYSLDDTKTAVDELHQLLDILVAFIIVIIWLIIFGLQISHFLVFISSQLLLVAFIFGNTCKTIFEAIIFLFIMHPFDVGNCCEVDDMQMVVEEMNILTTVFLRYDGQKITYPNSVLSTKSIGNYSRSPDMGDQVEFSVHISTPWEKIENLKERIIGYIRSRHDIWYSDPMVIVKDVEDMNRLKMVVWPKHKMNYHNMRLRWSRRALLIEEMIKVFRELDVEYRMLPHEVNVRNMPGLTSNKLPSIWMTCAG